MIIVIEIGSMQRSGNFIQKCFSTDNIMTDIVVRNIKIGLDKTNFMDIRRVGFIGMFSTNFCNLTLFLFQA